MIIQFQVSFDSVPFFSQFCVYKPKVNIELIILLLI